LEDLLPESGFCWKRTVKTPYFRRSRKFQKIPENYILPKDSGSQKKESRGARGQPHT
jgi:hypothetical protein